MKRNGVWNNRILLLLMICSICMICSADTASVNLVNAPLNPDYLTYRQTEAQESEHSAGFVPPSLDLSYLKGKDIITPATTDSYPSVYDLRTINKTTPVRDQNPWGTSWAFAAMGSLESSLKPGLDTDFSEKNMVNRNLWLTGPDTGGNFLKSGGYLAAGYGPLDETADPYPNSTWNYTSPSGPQSYPLKEILWIPGRDNLTDLATIKWAIYTYGAMQSSFYWSNSSWNATSNGYYYSSGNTTNRVIVLAGWNDSFNRNNFKNPAPGDGAFLFKNSLGTSWGDQGYGWISYYDTSLGKYNAEFIGSPSSNYGKIYQYDLAGTSTAVGSPPNRDLWGANVFNVTSDGNLSAVGFYTNDIPTSYMIRVYQNPNNGPLGSVINSQKIGTIAMSGYHIIPLTTPVALTSGENFSIVVHLENSGYEYPLQMEDPDSGPSGNTWNASAGQGYVSTNNSNWEDITTYFANTSICIKGYESIPSPTPTPTVTPTTTPTITPTVTPTPGESYVINATTNQLGYIYPSGLTSVEKGSNVTFRFQSRPGAAIENITVDGNPATIETGNTYTFPNVTANHDINLLCTVKSNSIIAGFTANTSGGQIPLTAQFNDTTLGNPTRWYWTFGDGGWSESQNPIHTYTKAGSWTVRLWVRNSWSSGILTKKGYIRVIQAGTSTTSLTDDVNQNSIQEVGSEDLITTNTSQ